MNSQYTRQNSTSPLTRSPSLGATYPVNNKNTTQDEIIIELLNRQESTLAELKTHLIARNDDDSQQVRILAAIHSQLAAQSTPLQFIWNAVLQTVVVAIALLFGMFSIFAWHGQEKANQMAVQANQIALFSVCLSSNSTTGACADVLSKADEALAYLLKQYIDGVDTAEFGAWPWTIPVNRDPTTLLIYVMVPILAGGFGAFASWKIYYERGRQLGEDQLQR